MHDIQQARICFPLSQVQRFRAEIKAKGLNGLRLGQAFYNYMQLDKCVQDRAFLDTLYNADYETADHMIKTYTNPNI